MQASFKCGRIHLPKAALLCVPESVVTLTEPIPWQAAEARNEFRISHFHHIGLIFLPEVT